MNWLRRWRQSDDEVGGELGEESTPFASGPQLAVSTIATKVATVGLWACLLMAPAGLVLGGAAVLQAPGQTAPAEAALVDSNDERAVAGEFAQRVVVAWLGATREDSDELSSLVTDADLLILPEDPQPVSDLEVAGIEQVDQAWSVTVAATVTGAKDVTQRRFYQVPIMVSGESVTALSLPAPVTGPVVAASPKLDYREPLSGDLVVSDTVAQFLAAYLGGEGDVARYLSPGSEIPAIEPPVFSEVTVQDLRGSTELIPGSVPDDGDTVQVLVIANGVVSKTQAATVTYALSLTARAGRWEITAIDPAPALSPQSADLSPDGLGGTNDSTESTTTP